MLKSISFFIFFCNTAWAKEISEEEKLKELTCPDMLSSVSLYAIPGDPDVNYIYQLCLRYCLSKLGLLHRLKNPKSPKEEKILLRQIKILNLILATSLRALRMAFVVFKTPEFRHKLNQVVLKVQEKRPVFNIVND
jgi:hypothetical protein